MHAIITANNVIKHAGYIQSQTNIVASKVHNMVWVYWLHAPCSSTILEDSLTSARVYNVLPCTS